MNTLTAFESSENYSKPLPLALSPAAKRGIETYIGESGGYADGDTLQRAARTVESLSYFAPDALPVRALDAAAMQPLVDSLEHPNRVARYRAAGRGFLEYFTYQGNRNTRSNSYVGTLLGDSRYIKAAANLYRDRLDDESINLLEGREVIPREAWTQLRVGANIPEIAKVSRITNIEAQLARAALTVDYIVHATDDDQELFRNILRTETFYAPLLEVYGLHAFDMMAQSNAGKARVMKSGKEWALEHAFNTMDRAKQTSTEEIIQQFFGRAPQEHLFQTAQESLYGEVITFSSTSLRELTDNRQSGELNTRFKSVGKYALKMIRNPHYSIENEAKPADVFGMLAVLPNEAQLGAFFADTVGNVLKSDTIELATSASKSHPIFIQGSPEFVRRISEQIPSNVRDRYVQSKVIHDMPADSIYQVAKFTATLSINGQELPVEFQFQTKNDRANARLGVPSHMNHNAGEGMASIIPGTPSDLRTIFMRKNNIDPKGELVDRFTIPHGEEFKARFEDAISN